MGHTSSTSFWSGFVYYGFVKLSICIVCCPNGPISWHMLQIMIRNYRFWQVLTECGRISRAAQSFPRPQKRPRTSFSVFWFIILDMYQHCWTRETLAVPLYFSMGCPNMSPNISRQTCFDIFRHRHASPNGASLPEHYVKILCATHFTPLWHRFAQKQGLQQRALSPYFKTKIN